MASNNQGGISRLTSLIGDTQQGYDNLLQQQQDANSFGFDNFNQGFATVSAGIQGISSLANIYAGFKQLDIANEELDLKKQKFKQATNELNRVRRVTSRLTASFG